MAALVERGDRVWAAVRRDEDAARLAAEYGDAVRVVQFDVTDDAAVARAGAQVVADGPLDGVVDNAGMALPGPLEFLPTSALRDQLEVNVVGQLRVIQSVMPAIRQVTGRIVVVGSIGGRIAGPMIGAYHASKFALLGLTDTLRAELAPWRIPVILIEPGVVATPIWSRGADSADRVASAMPDEAHQLYARQIARVRSNAARSAKNGLPPERAAQTIVSALTDPRPRPRYLVGRDARIAAVVARLPHRLRYRLTAAD